MKHATNIEPAVSRAFSLPLESCDGNLLSFDLPVEPDKWHALPERFIEGIDFALGFIGRSKRFSDKRWMVDYAHMLDGKVIATDSISVVEFVTGKSDGRLTLTAKHVRMIKAFGAVPTHSAIHGRKLHLRKIRRTSVEMIEKHYAVHLKNSLDAAAINVRKSKPASQWGVRYPHISFLEKLGINPFIFSLEYS